MIFRSSKKLLEDFQEDILGGAILVYNRYSEQSVCNLTKRRTLPPLFSENGWLWTDASEQSKIAILFITIKNCFGIMLKRNN